MMRRRWWTIVALLLLVACLLVQDVSGQEVGQEQELREEELIEGSTRLIYGQQEYYVQNANEKKKFHLEVDLEKRQGKKRVFILIEGLDMISEPQVYIISKKKGSDNENKWPDYFLEQNQSSMIDYQTKSYERGLINIDEDAIELKHLRVLVVCKTRCIYNIQAYHEEYNSLGIEGNSLVYLNRLTGEGTITLEVTNSILITDLIYEYELINQYENPGQTFDAYINFQSADTMPTSSSFQSFGKGWGSGAGLGITLLKKEKLVDGKIRVLFKGKGGMVIQVRAISYNSYRDIEPYELVNDMLLQDSPEKIFIFNIASAREKFGDSIFESNDLIFSLTNFQGESDLRIALIAEEPVKSWNETLLSIQYTLESTNRGDDSVTLTPQDLAKLRYVVIQVKSIYFSLFALRAYPVQENVDNYLVFGYGETIELEANELITYKLVAEGNTMPTLLTISLKPIIGSPTLYIADCSDGDCSITLKDIEDAQDELKKTDKLMYALEEGIQTFRLENNPNDCDPDGICTYIVAVHSPKESKFYLLANHNLTHNVLQEHRPFHDIVYYGNKNHYKFSLHNTEYISSISFELTYLHGEVSMFLSSRNEYPDINQWEWVSFFNQIKVDQVRANIREYFLTVQGDSIMAEYTIQVRVTYKDTGFVSWYQLYNDEYTEITIDNKNQKQYFEFFYAPTTTSKVNLLVSSLEGSKFDIYLSDKDSPLPSEQNYKYALVNQRKLTIDYANNTSGKLYGVIIPHKNMTLDDTSSLKVGIKINDEQQIQTLDFGKIFKGEIIRRDSLRYSIKLLSSEPVLIQKKAYHSDQSQFLVEVLLVNDKQEKVSGFVPSTEPFYLSSEQIESNCPQLAPNSANKKKENCFIHLALRSEENIQFQLLVDYDNKIQTLFADIHQLVKLKRVENKFQNAQTYQKKMFYYISSLDDIEIFVGKINSLKFPDVFITIDEVSTYNNRDQWRWPTREKKQFEVTHDEEHQNALNIEKQSLEELECQKPTKHCVLLFLAEFSSFEKQDNFSFSMTINHQVMSLYEGHPERSTVGFEEFVYFKVQLPQISTIQRLWIHLTQLNEIEPILIVARDRKPTDKDHEYSSDSVSLSVSIEINDQNINSTFYIALRSIVESMDSSVLIHYELVNDTRITPIYLQPSLPIQKLIETNETAYFIIRNPQPSSGFQIIVSKDIGDILIHANVFDETEDSQAYLKYLPNQMNKSIASSESQPFQEYLTINQSLITEYCRFLRQCAWIIGVKARKFSYFQIQYVRFDNPVYLMVPNQIEKVYWESHKQLKIKVLIEAPKFVLEYISIYGDIELSVWDASKQIPLKLRDGPDLNKQYLMREIELLNQPQNGFSDHFQINLTNSLSANFIRAFIISAKIEGHPQRVAFGVPYKYRFKSKGQSFYFQNHPDIASLHSNYSIQIILPEYKQNTHISKGFVPKLNLTFLYPNQTIKQSQFTSKESFNGVHHFKISGISDEGIYMLNISHGQPYEYILIANQDSNIKLIQPNIKVYESDQTKKNTQKTYELYIPDENYNVVFQFEACQGQFSYSFSKDYDIKSNKKFQLGHTMSKIGNYIESGKLDTQDMEIELLQKTTKSHLLLIKPNFAGTFFINTLLKKNSKTNNVYTFSTYFSKNDLHPALYLGFKNGGFIEFYDHHPNTHSFALEKIDCLERCSEITKYYKFLSFTYILAFSNDLLQLKSNFQCHDFSSGDLTYIDQKTVIGGSAKVEVQSSIRGIQHNEQEEKMRMYVTKKAIEKSLKNHKHLYFMGKVIVHMVEKDTNEVQSISFYHQGASFTKSQIVGYSAFSIFLLVVLGLIVAAGLAIAVYWFITKKMDRGVLKQEQRIELEKAKGKYDGHHQLQDEV